MNTINSGYEFSFEIQKYLFLFIRYKKLEIFILYVYCTIIKNIFILIAKIFTSI